MVEKSDLPPYPLEQVLEVKKHRVENAEKVVKEKEKALKDEQEKLKAREAERDKVKDHLKAKVQQLRDEFTGGTTSNKIDQIKVYIKVVKEKLAIEEKKVRDQQQQVELAEKNLEIAKNELRARRKEEDKIKTHREFWEKEMMKEVEIQEGRLEDEIGSTMFLSKYIQKRKRSNFLFKECQYMTSDLFDNLRPKRVSSAEGKEFPVGKKSPTPPIDAEREKKFKELLGEPKAPVEDEEFIPDEEESLPETTSPITLMKGPTALTPQKTPLASPDATLKSTPEEMPKDVQESLAAAFVQPEIEKTPKDVRASPMGVARRAGESGKEIQPEVRASPMGVARRAGESGKEIPPELRASPIAVERRHVEKMPEEAQAGTMTVAKSGHVEGEELPPEVAAVSTDAKKTKAPTGREGKVLKRDLKAKVPFAEATEEAVASVTSKKEIVKPIKEVGEGGELLAGAAYAPVQEIRSAKPTVEIRDTTVREALKALVEAIAKSITEEIHPDKTEIKIELKLPIFEGATLEITEYKTAQKEFNITFHNLTNPVARTLIETNEQSLRTQLIERGYTLQMVSIEPKTLVTTTTTTPFEERGGAGGRGEKKDRPFGEGQRYRG